MSNDQTIMIPIPQQSSGGGVPLPQHQDRAELLDRINPMLVVDLARHMLLGEEYNGSSWVKIPALQNDSLTELGAWKIASQLHAVANLATTVTRYKEDMIRARLREMVKSVMIQLVGNFNQYGIKNVSQFYFVYNIFMGIAMAVLFQAGDGSIQALLSTIKSESTNINTDKKEPGRIRRALGLA